MPAITITDPREAWKDRRLTTCTLDILEQVRTRSRERGVYAVDETSIAMMTLWSLLLWERKIGLVALERSGVDRFDLARDLDRLLDEALRGRHAAYDRERDVLVRADTREPFEAWDFAALMEPILLKAEQEAKGLGHNYVGSEHLLLAVLQLGDATLAALMEGHDASTERVRRSIVEVLRG